jgi:hypothetical protein
MPSKKSLIPPKFQIPAAVVLGAVFVLNTLWRLGVFAGTDAPGVPVTQVAVAEVISTPSAAPEVSLGELRSMLAVLDEDDGMQMARAPHAPRLMRNPFVWDLDARATSDPDTRAKRSPGQAERMAERKAFFDTVNFAGTCIIDDSAVAIVDGDFLRTGDTLGGFEIERVRAQELVLRDAIGTEVLTMTAPDQRPNEDAEVWLEVEEQES